MRLQPALPVIVVLYFVTMLVLMVVTPRYEKLLEELGAVPDQTKGRSAWLMVRYLLTRGYRETGDARLAFFGRALLTGYIFFFSLIFAFMIILLIVFFSPVL